MKAFLATLESKYSFPSEVSDIAKLVQDWALDQPDAEILKRHRERHSLQGRVDKYGKYCFYSFLSAIGFILGNVAYGLASDSFTAISVMLAGAGVLASAAMVVFGDKWSRWGQRASTAKWLTLRETKRCSEAEKVLSASELARQWRDLALGIRRELRVADLEVMRLLQHLEDKHSTRTEEEDAFKAIHKLSAGD